MMIRCDDTGRVNRPVLAQPSLCVKCVSYCSKEHVVPCIALPEPVTNWRLIIKAQQQGEAFLSFTCVGGCLVIYVTPPYNQPLAIHARGVNWNWKERSLCRYWKLCETNCCKQWW